MSELINKGDFNPGCIYRIELENFVTYKKVELFPGRSLNLIIGPNGTGKSTFVCAIILGLCGKPSSIGRDTKISTFVKNGYQTASIEIELYNKKGKRNIVIKRTFDRQDCSKWYIDNESSNEKKVLAKLKPLNIQVDNLCQLLPQDKVQDFSALKPKELLENTLQAVGRHDSIETWKKLIEMKKELQNLTTNLKRDENNLEKLRKDNESLKQKIDEFNKRTQIEKDIEICKKKQLWLVSQQMRDKVGEYQKDRIKAKKMVQSNKVKLEPLKNELECLKRDISQLEKRKIDNSRQIQEYKDQLKKLIQSFEIKEDQLKNIDTSFREKLDIHKKKELILSQAKMKLDKLITDKRALEMKKWDENNLKLELEENLKNKQIVNAAKETLNKKRTEATYYLDNHIRLFGNKIQNMKDVQTRRLEMLKRHRRDTYAALTWLRDNRQRFSHPVYEPMMLEINFNDPKFARYLESAVPARDLIAFTFESKEDMNLFNEIVRNQLKLKLVNAVCSQGGDFTVQARDFQHLRHLGFHTCLASTVTGPPAILRYLCQQSRIHQIPIGNDHTYRNSDKVPKEIRYYFTENHRFSVRVSNYGSVSSTTVEVNKPFLLANTVDEQEIISLESQLQEYQQKKQEVENDISRKLAELDKKLHELECTRREKKECLDKINSTKTQIQLQTNKIKALEDEPAVDMERERAECDRLRKEYVSKECSLHSEISDIMNKIHNRSLIKMKICVIQLDVKREEMLKKDSDYRKLQNELQTATNKLDDIERNLQISASQAKQKLIQVKQVFGAMLPDNPSFPYKREFDDLPSDMVLLHEYENERLTKINLMEDVDIQTLKDYENRNKEIERLTNLLKTSDETTNTKRNLINKLKSEWLPPLELLITEINSLFAEMIAKKPGCAGKITLNKESGDEDFSDYGVAILVKFRNSEEMSPLTRHTQSGGERAFCTAIYLLALQGRTVAPFRCVDEINQGLDVKNERIMLQLLIKETTKSNSQYFLLTPTLLDDLEYNERVTVHTVMNGRHILDYKQWNQNEFLRRARNGLN